MLADAGAEKAGFVIADIDLGKVDAAQDGAVLTHDRKYAAPVLHKAAIARAAGSSEQFRWGEQIASP